KNHTLEIFKSGSDTFKLPSHTITIISHRFKEIENDSIASLRIFQLESFKLIKMWKTTDFSNEHILSERKVLGVQNRNHDHFSFVYNLNIDDSFLTVNLHMK